MSKQLTPEDFQKAEEEKEMQVRAEKFMKAVKYQEKKFNCIITPCHAFVGNNMRAWIEYQALPVKEGK
jgi:hypothetical protein